MTEGLSTSTSSDLKQNCWCLAFGAQGESTITANPCFMGYQLSLINGAENKIAATTHPKTSALGRAARKRGTQV